VAATRPEDALGPAAVPTLCVVLPSSRPLAASRAPALCGRRTLCATPAHSVDARPPLAACPPSGPGRQAPLPSINRAHARLFGFFSDPHGCALVQIRPKLDFNLRNLQQSGRNRPIYSAQKTLEIRFLIGVLFDPICSDGRKNSCVKLLVLRTTGPGFFSAASRTHRPALRWPCAAAPPPGRLRSRGRCGGRWPRGACPGARRSSPPWWATGIMVEISWLGLKPRRTDCIGNVC